MPIFAIAKTIRIPRRKLAQAEAIAQRVAHKLGQPKPESQLVIITDFGVPLTLRLADRDILRRRERETQTLSILTQRADSEIQLANQHMRNVVEMLQGHNKTEAAEILQRLYPMVLPYLVLGRHGNPVHHTTKVTEIAVKIALGENLNGEDLEILVVSALFHDAGFARAKADKIRKADIEVIEDPQKKEAKRAEAIQSRKAHMLMGASLAWEVLTGFNQKYGLTFSRLDIRRIQEIIRRHDDPTIEELTGTNSGEWLFLPKERLLRMHREADRLWMLTPEGLEVDLIRDAQKGKRDPEKRLQGNLTRHKEEGELYIKAFGEEASSFELKGGTFYSTRTGYQLYHEFMQETARTYGIEISPISV